jgi:cell division protein FtsQ
VRASVPPSGNVRRSAPPPAPAPAPPPSEPPQPVVKAVSTKPPPSKAPAGPKKPSKVIPVLRAMAGLAMIVGIGAGGKRRGPEEIANIAQVSKGQNVFSIDLERSRAKLAADPWIESAELSRQLPGTITIRVTEREAAGVVAMPEGTYLVTRDGAIIKRVEAGDPMEFHVVTGVALKQLVEDREGATRTIRKALDLALDYDRSPLAQRSPLEEVHVEATGDMTLVCGKSGVVLRMGGAPYKRKLDQAVRIMGELDRRGAKPDTVMLDDEARPDRVVVRMR